MKRTQYLFSYGSLQQEGVQKEILHRRLLGNKDMAQGYSISTKKFMGQYPMAVPSGHSSDEIAGISFNVSFVELYWIDQYETAAYKRVPIVLKSGKRAWIYIENGSY